MFRQEIQECKQDFIKDGDERPSYMPEYSGRATMALLKKNRLKLLKQVKFLNNLHLFFLILYFFLINCFHHFMFFLFCLICLFCLFLSNKNF